MLVWSRSARFIVWLLAALLIGIIFIAPLAVILAASLAKQWNGVFPTGFTLEHYASAAGGASGDSVVASLITGLVASLLALLADRGRRWLRKRKAWASTVCCSSFERRAVGISRASSGRVQPAPCHNGTTAIILAHFCGSRLRSGMSLPTRTAVAELRGGRRGLGTPEYRLFKDASTDRALPGRRLRLGFALSWENSGRRSWSTARLGDAAGRHRGLTDQRRHFLRSGVDAILSPPLWPARGPGAPPAARLPSNYWKTPRHRG